MYRVMYKTENPVDVEVFKNDETVVACTAMKWEGSFYTYIETITKESPVYDNFEHSEMMYEIFHYCPLEEKDVWIKQRDNSKGSMRFIKLQPEMFSSYIFQHFRFQEELRGVRTKYSSIFCFGNQLAMYEEDPNIKYDPMVEGALNTHDTDEENWQAYMREHFMPGDSWTPGEYIYSYFVEKR